MRGTVRSAESGFSLAELMVAMTIMLIISGAAIGAMLRMTSAQATIWNRTQMHSGIRGATEVLQQEVGQAGRIALGGTAVTFNGASTAGSGVGAAKTITVNSTAGMFVGEILTLGTGTSQENVTVTIIPSTTTVTVTPLPITGTVQAHNDLAPVRAFGGFATGIVPSADAPPAGVSYPNGSRGDVLKLYGDINGDGNMVYVEYSCVVPSGGIGYLYRNSMAWNTTGGSPAAAQSQILLANVKENPPVASPAPCFTYQHQQVGTDYYVTDVAITLTVQTQVLDPVTKRYQDETKALLNVSPRNVFNTWQIASLGITERIQPMPPSIIALLP